MSEKKPRHARALYAFLETEWAAMDIRPTAWCRKVGISDATVLRWRDDENVEPSMALLRQVAESLGRPLVDILLAAGYLTKNDLNGHKPAERIYSLDDALRLDKTLSPQEREAHRQLRDLFTDVRTGRKRKGTVRGSVS